MCKAVFYAKLMESSFEAFFCETIFLTNGFVKKTQKTYKSEIALAKEYREDYMERHGELK
jgi:phage-related protein